MEKLKLYLSLFLNMFKIGLITFGGGYAMIAIIQRELVEKKKWIEQNEFLDLISIAESTPGPIAINSATYIGYKIGGVFGSVCATFGVVLPSFLIIFAISQFFDAFLSLKYVQYAFMGIQVCVAYLILSAGIKMFMAMEKNPLSIILSVITTGVLVCFTLFAISFSTIFYILIGGAVGLTVYLITYIKVKRKVKKSQSADTGADMQHDEVSDEIIDAESQNYDTATIEDSKDNKGDGQC